MKLPQTILVFGLVRLWAAQAILAGNNRTNRTRAAQRIVARTNRTNRTGFIGADGKELRKPDNMVVGLHQHTHHQLRMLNGRHRHHAAQRDAASTEPVKLVLDKAQEAAEQTAQSEQQKEKDIERAAKCTKVNHHTLAHKACKHFMRDLCHLGESGGGDLATLQEVKEYCESFFIAASAPSPAAPENNDNEYKGEPMSEDYKPPPMPWSNKKKEQPLPEHGYWGDKVEHDDMKTFTGDWQTEFGPRQGGDQNIQEICKRHPKSEWCRIYAHRYGPAYGYSGGGDDVGTDSWSDKLPGMPGYGKDGGKGGGGYPWSHGGEDADSKDGGKGSGGGGWPWSQGGDNADSSGEGGGGGWPWSHGGGSGEGDDADGGGAGKNKDSWWPPFSAAWRSSGTSIVSVLSLLVIANTFGLP